jgi:hypothetical protein
MLRSVLAAAVLALFAVPAGAGEAGDIMREALYAGDLDRGIARLQPLLESDNEAAFGTGFITFVKGIEGFAQALYRHGIAAPATPPVLGGGPPLAVPVPTNPNPEPLDYATIRAVVMALRDRLDEASLHLERAGQSGEYVLPIDPLLVRIDADGDGTVEETESIANVFMAAFGMASPDAPTGRTEPPAAPADLTIGFDRADAIWLTGYSQVFAAQADFLLAHDFEDFFNATFHRIFPRAGLPMQEYAGGGTLAFDPSTDSQIADAIAGIHTINWTVEDPERLAGVLQRFKRITQLSRANWDAILAETDDNRELIPNPGQTSIFPDGEVTDEVVAAWLETLDVADRILDGELLVPHWRFRQGFDLSAYFHDAKRTDLVMLVTGYDAIPYLRDGPIADASSFAAANRVFGDNLLGYIFWFN